MYLAVFALLTVVGTWAAWHNNPLYSRGATVRFVGVVGLAIAAVIGAIVAAVDLTAAKSPLVFGTTMAAVLFFGTIALIWIVVAVSSPQVTPLPPTATLVRVHRARLLPYARWFGIVIVALTLVAVLVPGEWKVAVYVGGGMFVFLGAILLFTGYLAALRLDRSLSSIEIEPWLHWRYTPEAWNAWTDVEIARLQATSPHWIWSRDWKRPLLPLVLVVGGVYLFDPGSFAWKTAYLGALAVLGLVIFSLANRYAKGAPARMRRLLTNAAPEAYLGPAGVFADGVYTEWQTAANYLVQATIDERLPRSVTFLFRRILPGSYAGPVDIAQSVLIPPNAASDIVRLQSSLSAVCPSANVSLA